MTDDGTKAFTAGAVAIGVAAALLLPGAAAAKPGASVADLRGDVDRDAVIGPGDEDGEDGWSRERGADLAPLQTMGLPDVPATARGTVALTGRGAPFGRLFLRQGPAWRPLKPTDAIDAPRLRTGLGWAWRPRIWYGIRAAGTAG